MRTQTYKWVVIFALAVAGLGCNQAGSGNNARLGFEEAPGPLLTVMEEEPNDTAAGARTLPAGMAGRGFIEGEDQDLWAFSAIGGSVIRVELFATRIRHLVMIVNGDAAQVDLLGQDGVTVLLQHESMSFDWGLLDFDIPRFHVPDTGVYYVRVRGADTIGSEAAYAVTVTPVALPPLQFEAEPQGVMGPNNMAAGAESIIPGTVLGWHDDLDVDMYAFEITEPSIVMAQTVAHRNGQFFGSPAYFDPVLELRHAGGSLIAEADEQFFSDAGLSYGITTPGTYVLAVDQAVGSAGNAEYFLDLHVRPTSDAVMEVDPNNTFETGTPIAYGDIGIGVTHTGDYFQFEGTAGDMVLMRVFSFFTTLEGSPDLATTTLFGPDADPIPVSHSSIVPFDNYRAILQTTGTHAIKLQPATASGTSYWFTLDRVRAAEYETEPNNTRALAGMLDANGRVAGRMDGAEIDYFRFTAQAGELVNFAVYASETGGIDAVPDFSGHGSTLEPTLQIWDTDGVPWSESLVTGRPVTAQAVTDPLPPGAVAFVAPETGTYFVSVLTNHPTSPATDYYILERR